MSELPEAISAEKEKEKEKEKYFSPRDGRGDQQECVEEAAEGRQGEEGEACCSFTEKGEKEKKEKKEKKEAEVCVDRTPEGEKKRIGDVFPPSYQPKYVESAWQAWWEQEGYYAPDVQKGMASSSEEKFVMVIPPPNVTGSLHFGSCVDFGGGGHVDTMAPHAWQGDAVGSWYGPCGDSNAICS